MYIADGAGRDGFVYQTPTDRYGKQGSIIRQVQKDSKVHIIQTNKFWEKEATKDKSPSNMARDGKFTKVHGATSEKNDTEYFKKHSTDMSSSLNSTKRKTQDIMLEPRIPNYQGHIPSLTNCVGVSPHSTKFHDILDGSFDSKSSNFNNLNTTVPLPSLSHSPTKQYGINRESNTNFRLSNHTGTFSSLIDPPQKSINVGHSGSFAGHMPNSHSYKRSM